MTIAPTIYYPDELNGLLSELDNSYLVGGCVRDSLLGLKPKDIDIEVYKMSYPDLQEFLGKYGKVDLVGKAFGVIKLTLPSGNTYDFSLARKDSKIENGVGHKAFTITTDPNMTVEEGCARRDLTINSLAYDPRQKRIIDPFGGLQDIRNRLLKHTSPQFTEDPLRVLRIMQFAARFNFDVHPDTVKLSASIKDTCPTLPKERIGEEWHKALTKGVNIKKGLQFLVDSEWIEHFPEIAALKGCQQDKEDWHPEGDAFEHTGYCCNALATNPQWQQLEDRDRYTAMLGVLCHDLGKPATTKQEFRPKLGRLVWVSPGHDKAGEAPTLSFLKQIDASNEVVKQVVPLVLHHMDHLQPHKDEQIRRLAVALKPSSIYKLGFITEADHSGRPPLPAGQPVEMQKIINRSAELGCLNHPPVQILHGRHIEEWTILKPGKAYGVLCHAAYEAQLKGEFSELDGAQKWFAKNRGRILENAKLAPERFIGGQELRNLYAKAGPELGNVHRDLMDMQLDGKLTSREQAITYLQENAEKYKLTSESIATLKPVEQELA